MANYKRKIDSECRIFKEKWTDLYVFVPINRQPFFLVCKDKLLVFKEYNIKRHKIRYRLEYDSYVCVHREKMILKFINEIVGLTKLLNTRKGDSEAALRASFRVAHILVKETKALSEGECVKRCILAVVEELYPEKKSVF